MKTLLKILGGIGVVLILAVTISLTYISTALPNVDPAPEITIEPTTERIERGKYLANSVMGCTHCHSPVDKTKFAHPIKKELIGAGGQLFGVEEGFPGNYYAPNLTPANLGSWTDGEIYRAITTGVTKDGRALFPIMPYQRFSLIEQEDLYSIIAYLRTLEPIENTVPPSESLFPMNFIINTIPVNSPPAPVLDKKDPVAYGKYLTSVASCIDCHTPKGSQGDIPGMTFAGGMEFHMADGSITRTANLTPDMETGLGSWTEEQFLKRFKMYADPSFEPHTVAEGTFNTAMPWDAFAQMTEEELKAIYAYLRSIEPISNPVVKFTPVQALAKK